MKTITTQQIKYICNFFEISESDLRTNILPNLPAIEIVDNGEASVLEKEETSDAINFFLHQMNLFKTNGILTDAQYLSRVVNCFSDDSSDGFDEDSDYFNEQITYTSAQMEAGLFYF